LARFLLIRLYTGASAVYQRVQISADTGGFTVKSLFRIIAVAMAAVLVSACSGVFGGGGGGGGSADDRSGELIPNTSFTGGTNGWDLFVYTDGGAAATMTTADGDGDDEPELAVEITDGGTEWWQVGVAIPGGLDVREGDLFELTFTAWMEGNPEGHGLVAVKIDENGEDIDGDGSAYEPYFFQRQVLRSEPVTYTRRIGIYQAAGYTHENARLAFDLGSEAGIAQSGTVYIDDVSLKLVMEPEAFSTAVSSSAMRGALLQTIREEGDRQDGAERFSDLTEAEVTAYHLASLRGIWLGDDEFEDSGSTASAFDLSAVDFSYFGRLRGIGFDDLPVTNSDVQTVAELTRIRSLEIGNTTGNENSFTGVTDISPVADLPRLRRLGLQENPIPISNLSSTITPENFPELEGLRLGLIELGTPPPTAEAVSIFEAFGDAGHVFREVTLQNASLTNSDFQSLYSSLLSQSKEEMDWLNLNDWDEEGQLDESVLDEIAQLTELEGLELAGNAFGSIANLSSLTKLREFDVSESSALTDFSVLSNFDELEALHVGGTGFGDDDWSSITGLTNLEYIELWDTPVTDISPLETLLDAGGFSDGGEVSLGDRSSSFISSNQATIDALADAGVSVEYDEVN
jgi:hypothetical protein